MGSYRQALSKVIGERLRMVRGVLPAEAKAYQQFILRLFASTGSRIPEKHFLLTTLANGDWRKSDCVEVYVAPGLKIDERTLLDGIVRGLVFALSHRCFMTFPRHRWTGCDLAIDQVGLALAIHNLGGLAMEMAFAGGVRSAVAEHGGPGHEVDVEEAQEGQEGPGEAAADHAMPVQEHLGRRFVQAAGRVTDQAHEHQDVPHEDARPQAQSPSEHAAENAKRARLALEWLRQKPLAELVILRLILAPIVKLLHKYIARSGESWQTRAAVQSLKEHLGLGGSEGGQGAISVYVGLMLEKDFHQELEHVLASEDWKWVPRDAWCLQQQTLAFRLSSKLGCLVHQLLVAPTLTYPLKLFRLLQDRDYLTAILADGECMMDAFTLAFLKKYPGQQCTSQEAMVCLQVMSRAGSCETVGLEWGHGRVQRLVSAQKVQTHIPTMKYVNAQWVGQRYSRWSYFCTRKLKTLGSQEVQKKRPAGSVGRPSGKRRVFKKGGGGLRAFISLQKRGSKGRTSFKEMARAYREAKEQGGPQYQEAQRVGEAATALVQSTGKSAFGGPYREARRSRMATAGAASSSAAPAIEVKHAPRAEGEDVDMTSLEVWHQLEVAAGVTQIRAEQRKRSRQKRVEEEAELGMLRRYVEERSQEVVAKIYAVLPELVSIPMQLAVVPDSPLCWAQVCFDNLARGVAVAAWSHKHTKSSNLKSVLMQDWTHKNRLLSEQPAALPAVGVDESSKPSACREAGVCLCRDQGRSLRKLHNAVLKVLKEELPRTVASSKQLLLDGYICLLFEGTPPSSSSGWHEYCMEILEDEGFGSQVDAGRFWVHIGHHYLKPYRPTVQTLEETGEAAGNTLWLKQTHEFNTLVRSLQRLSLMSSWQVTVYEMVSTKAPTASFDPRYCLVRRWSPQALDCLAFEDSEKKAE